MNSKRLEEFAILSIKTYLLCIPEIESYLNTNDKTPVWDGYLYLYNQSKLINNAHLQARIPVQVKCSTRHDPNTKKINFPVSISNLNIFLSESGVLYFVVAASKDLSTSQIFFHPFTKTDISAILAGKRPRQKTKSIEFYPVPDDPHLFLKTIINFIINKNRQQSFPPDKLFSFEQIKSKSITSLTLSPLIINNKNNPILNLFNKNLQVYVSTDTFPIPIPVKGPTELKSIQKHGKCTIKTKNFSFESTINIEHQLDSDKLNSLLVIPNFIILNSTKNLLTFVPSQNITEQLFHLKTIIDFIDHKFIQIGDVTIDKSTVNFSLLKQNHYTNFKDQLNCLTKLDELVKYLHINDDINPSVISTQDWGNILDLHDALINSKPLNIAIVSHCQLALIPFLKSKILTLITKSTTNESECFIADPFAINNLKFEIRLNNSITEAPIYSSILDLDWEDIANLHPNDIVESFKKFKPSEQLWNCANACLLKLISVYDKTRNYHFIQIATDLSDWLFNTAPQTSRTLSLLNKAQCLKRQNKLDKQDLVEIQSIISRGDTSSIIKFGASLILGKKSICDAIFKTLSTDERSDIKQYPIYNLYKDAK